MLLHRQQMDTEAYGYHCGKQAIRRALLIAHSAISCVGLKLVVHCHTIYASQKANQVFSELSTEVGPYFRTNVKTAADLRKAVKRGANIWQSRRRAKKQRYVRMSAIGH
jgi:hypothetical protein